ncbi:MAG: glycosyltransferase [Bacteroidales bacterium]
MNILFIGRLPAIPFLGGVERVTDLLTKLFIKEGFEVVHLVLEPIETQKDYVYRCKQYSFTKDLDCSIEEYYKKILVNEKIDIVINQHPIEKMTDFIYEYSNENKIITIGIIHSTVFFGFENYRYHYFSKINSVKSFLNNFVKVITYPWLFYFLKSYKIWRLRCRYKELYERIDSLVFLSESYVKQFSEIFDSMSSKVTAIPNVNSYMADENSLLCKKKQILYIGRIDRDQKRVDRIIKIWQKISTKFPEWNLLLVGDGDQKDQLVKFVKNKQIPRVSFVGQVDIPIEYYKESSILGMTSNFEGFPMVLNEAMKFGCVPIVYNSFSALKDIVGNVDESLIVDPFNESAYIKEMSSLMSDNEYLQMLSSSCIEQSKRYDAESVMNLWVELFKDLTNKD